MVLETITVKCKFCGKEGTKKTDAAAYKCPTCKKLNIYYRVVA